MKENKIIKVNFKTKQVEDNRVLRVWKCSCCYNYLRFDSKKDKSPPFIIEGGGITLCQSCVEMVVQAYASAMDET